MHLHEFLARVHEIVQPELYLEVGVQHGTSLILAHRALAAWGVDPNPLTSAQKNQKIFKMPSDDFFAEVEAGRGTVRNPDFYRPPYPLDLGFIDGLHHYEQALRDFLNMEKLATDESVIIFDDVLPRNQAEAARVQCPGDWTGDVWKVTEILLENRPELRIMEVDTAPTGTLVVYGFNDEPKTTSNEKLMKIALEDRYYLNEVVPDSVLQRKHAFTPAQAFAELADFSHK